MDCSLPCSSICGILQARILEWVAISFSRRSSQPRDWTQVSRLQADALPSEPPGKLSLPLTPPVFFKILILLAHPPWCTCLQQKELFNDSEHSKYRIFPSSYCCLNMKFLKIRALPETSSNSFWQLTERHFTVFKSLLSCLLIISQESISTKIFIVEWLLPVWGRCSFKNSGIHCYWLLTVLTLCLILCQFHHPEDSERELSLCCISGCVYNSFSFSSPDPWASLAPLPDSIAVEVKSHWVPSSTGVQFSSSSRL